MKHNIKTIYITLKKNIHVLRLIKDKVGLRVTVYTVPPASVEKPMLDRLADSSKPDVKNTSDIYAWASQRSPLWQSIDLKQGTSLISAAPPSWVRPQDI